MTLRTHPDEIVRESRSGLLAAHPSWERVALGDVADVRNGFAFRSSDFSKTEGVPLLRIRDVGRTRTDAFYVGEYDPAYLVETGSLVVGMDGDFRVSRWSGPPALLNQRVCKITVRDESKYDVTFLFYALPGYLDAINARTSSVTVKHLSSRTVAQIPLPLPPTAEQRRIVAAIEEQFSRVDAGDASLRRARASLRALRRAAYTLAFERQSPTRPLVDVSDPTRPICYGILKPKTTGQLTVPYVEVRSIRSGRIDVSSLHKTTQALHEEFRRSELRAGDVVLAIRGSFDRAAVVPPELDGANVSRDVARIAPAPGIDPRFLAHYLSGPTALRYYSERARGVGVRGVNIGDLRHMPVPVPRLDEQEGVVQTLEAQLSLIDDLSAQVDAALRRSAALRRAILDRAFTGKLVLQDPSDEPALVLLERITAERAARQTPRRRKVRA